MIELSEGTVTIDGLDLADIPRDLLRGRFNAIPQEPLLLSASVRTNMDPSSTATDAELESTLQSVQLWKVIEAMGGLDTKLEPESLSHGQKQMFCLARATIRHSALVVLDEVTSR